MMLGSKITLITCNLLVILLYGSSEHSMEFIMMLDSNR
jgi:hypothetical protein